jgi:hypothetical protein
LKEKHKQAVSNFSKEFIINMMGELVRFYKGMSKDDVTEILGEPYKIESSDNILNEKLVFKINNGNAISVRYSILFTSNELVYVAKLN